MHHADAGVAEQLVGDLGLFAGGEEVVGLGAVLGEHQVGEEPVTGVAPFLQSPVQGLVHAHEEGPAVAHEQHLVAGGLIALGARVEVEQEEDRERGEKAHTVMGSGPKNNRQRGTEASTRFQFTSPRMGFVQISRRWFCPRKKVRFTSASSPGASCAALKASLNRQGTMDAWHLFLTNDQYLAAAGMARSRMEARRMRTCFMAGRSDVPVSDPAGR